MPQKMKKDTNENITEIRRRKKKEKREREREKKSRRKKKGQLIIE